MIYKVFATPHTIMEPSTNQTATQIQNPTPTTLTVQYSGFWKRALAFILDVIVLGLLTSGIHFVLNAVGISTSHEEGISMLGGLQQYVGSILFLIYYVAMEASSLQGSLGKMALGLKVTDINGARLSFLRALARNAAKYISMIIVLIGFIMVAFTPKKQGLHDIIARTLVVIK